MGIGMGTFTLNFLAVGILLLIVTLIVLLVRKKGSKPSVGKKIIASLLVALTSSTFIVSALTHVNVIQLNLKTGFYLETKDFNNDGEISAIKVKVGFDYSYYKIANTYHLQDSQRTFRGTWEISVNELVLYNFSSGESMIFEVKNFGKELYLDGDMVYTFVQYI